MQFLALLLVVLVETSFSLNAFVISEDKGANFKVVRSFPKNAYVVIESHIDGVEFSSNWKIDTTLNNDGNIILVIPANQKQTIKVTAQGFKSELIKIPKLSQKNFRKYIIEKKFKAAKNGKGDFMLKTFPAGASVKVEGIPLKLNGKTPYLFNGWNAGDYTVILTKNGYDPIETEIRIEKNKRLEKIVELTPNWSDLSINTEPSNMDFYINGEKMGNTPLNLMGVEEGLRPGLISWRLQKAGFETLKGELRLDKGRQYEINEKSDLIEGSLRVTTDPKGANVLVDGQNYGTTPTTIENLKPGNHELTFTKMDFKDKIVSYNIYKASSSINVSLSSELGRLYVNCDYDDASINIYQYGYMVESVKGPDHEFVLEPGSYDLKIYAYGYKDVLKKVKVKGKRKKSISINLTRGLSGEELADIKEDQEMEDDFREYRKANRFRGSLFLKSLWVGYRGANPINTLIPGPEIGIANFNIEGNITQNIFLGFGMFNFDLNQQFGYLELFQFELGLVFPMNLYKTRLYITQRLGTGSIHPIIKNTKYGIRSDNKNTIRRDSALVGVHETAIRLEHSINKKWNIFTELNMKYLSATSNFWTIDPEGGAPEKVYVNGEGKLLKGFVPSIRFGVQFNPIAKRKSGKPGKAETP